MKHVYFEGRELRPWSEYLESDDLKVGEVYFTLQYLDSQTFIPQLIPLVFIGKNLDPGDDDMLYFQETSSYIGGVRPYEDGATWGAEPGALEVVVHTMKSRDCRAMTYDSALNDLLLCALRRQHNAGNSSKV